MHRIFLTPCSECRSPMQLLLRMNQRYVVECEGCGRKAAMADTEALAMQAWIAKQESDGVRSRPAGA